MDFKGTWHVVSSPYFEGDYLNMRVPAHVTLRQHADFVTGEYEIGLQYGTLNGGVYEDFIDLDFEGNDEMEDIFGEGQASLEGERLIFELWPYHGDGWIFECERRR